MNVQTEIESLKQFGIFFQKHFFINNFPTNRVTLVNETVSSICFQQ